LKTTFIYALKELAPGEFFSTKIRYVGKANDPYKRFEEHCQTKEKCHRGNWIRSLPGRGLFLQLEVLDEVPESEWEFFEKAYIKVYREAGYNLVNVTDGGEGVTMTLEIREKLRISALGNSRALGAVRSKETREKIRNFQTGKHHSPEAKEKMSKSHRGKTHSLETLEKMRLPQIGKVYKNNTSGEMGVRFNSRQNRWVARISQRFLGYFSQLEDAVAARAEAMKKYYGGN